MTTMVSRRCLRDLEGWKFAYSENGWTSNELGLLCVVFSEHPVYSYRNINPTTRTRARGAM